MARQFTGQHYVGADGIYHYPWVDTATGESGEELSYEGPSQGTQTAPAGAAPAAPVPVGTWGPTGFSYGASMGNYPGTQYGTPWNNPWSIGAGTSEQPYGWGVPGFGQDPIKILTEYLPYLNQMTTGERGGYIPGSGTLNGYRLDQPGLLGTLQGTQGTVNLRYGLGGAGDPTRGAEAEPAAQTPDQWVQGGPLFEWQLHSQGKLPRDVGYDPLTTLFMRSDTPSGINTAAWGAPQQYWQSLADAIGKGYIKPTERGWQALAAKNITPQSIGGAAPGMAGAAGAGGQGGIEGAYASIIAMQQAQIAAQIAYQEWQMRTGDEGLAMEKANEAWRQKFSEVQQAWTQQYQTAGMTGQLNGQDTLAKQQQMWNQGFQRDQFAELQRQNEAGNALNLLSQQSALQGPRDAFRYQQLNASTPGGLKDMLAGLAGRYNFAGSGFQGTPGAATLQSRTQDLLSGGQQGTGVAGQDGQSQFALPSPNQVNLANWGRLSPSGQQMALGAYESQGYYGADVEEALKRAAPRYTMAGGGQAQVGL